VNSEVAAEIQPPKRPRVGVSACLLGEAVRYDGGHKRQDEMLAQLDDKFDWVAVCPEVELGLGVPRETIQLERTTAGLRLLTSETRRDLTASMRDWAGRRFDSIGPLDGYLLKARSPSCGRGTAAVVGSPDPASGLFAEALEQRFPNLPTVEETDLADSPAREKFRRRVVAEFRLRGLFAPGWSRGDVVAFHTRHKLLLLAYSPERCETLGRLTATVAQYSPEQFVERYCEDFRAAFAQESTPGRHANALQHAAGYFSAELSRDERARLTQQLEDPPAAKRLIRRYAGDFGYDYLTSQIYLADDPWDDPLTTESGGALPGAR
jgi:uncharacterized protein YbbK (DUF523 family)/uncharacterized protein YbgA (DUF1722 family)